VANPNEPSVQTAPRPAGLPLPVEPAEPRSRSTGTVPLRALLAITIWSLLLGLGLLVIAFRALFGDAGALQVIVGSVSFGLTAAAFLLADRGPIPYYLLGGATVVTGGLLALT
jgi:hypothetical protein